MGREVRMVPKDWEHPKQNGRFKPLLAYAFDECLQAWEEENLKWQEGFVRDYSGRDAWKPRSKEDGSFEEWYGDRPEKENYMPEFPPGTADHLMMYENTSEGTPISPAFDTPEKLAKWLADNKASAMGGWTASYDEWLATIKAGWAADMIFDGKKLQSGVAYNAK